MVTRRGFEKLMSKGMGKIGKVMGEFKRGTLHSGSKKGQKVKSRKQAIAIAMSEAGMSKMMKKNPSEPKGSGGCYSAQGKIGIG